MEKNLFYDFFSGFLEVCIYSAPLHEQDST